MKKIPYEECFLRYNGYPVYGFNDSNINGMCLQGKDLLKLQLDVSLRTSFVKLTYDLILSKFYSLMDLLTDWS